MPHGNPLASNRATAHNPIEACRVIVRGAELPVAAYADLLDVRVEQDVDAPWMFALRFRAWNPQRFVVSWQGDELFELATPVSIEMGKQGKLAEVMTGEITGYELEVSAGETPVVTVYGYDLSHRMARTTRTRLFHGKTDSQIAEMIATENRLSPMAPSTGVEHPCVAQHNQTDLEFLRCRAELIDHEVVVERDVLHFRKRQDAGSPAVTLSSADDIVKLSGRLTARGLVDTMDVLAWDPNKKSLIKGTAIADELTPMGGAVGLIQAKERFRSARVVEADLPAFTEKEADQLARARLGRMAREFVTGRAMCLGRTDLRAGVTARLDGLGDRFSGIYDVVSATHTYSPKKGYETSFNLQRNST